MKKFISLFLAVAMLISLVPIASVFAIEDDVDYSVLSAKIETAKVLIYKGYGEQSRKYLADRTERAETVLYDYTATQDEVDSAVDILQTAIDSLKSMYGFETIALNGIAAWTKDDVAAMNECSATPVLDTDVKPEGAVFSVKVKGKDGVCFSNAKSRSSVSGETPFNADMSCADGLKLWVNVGSPAVLTVGIGVRSVESNYVYTASDVHVDGVGYVYLPFDYFVSDSSEELALEGGLNLLTVKAEGVSEISFADVSAYNEILEGSTKAQYSETKITAKSQIEDGAYYKIIESGSGKAVTLGPEITETATQWNNCLQVQDNNLKFTLEENIEGDRTQMWQFAASPAGNGTYILINKSSSNVIQITPAGGGIENRQVDLNSNLQQWQVSISGGKATFQVKGAGKLTTAGDTVKATTSTTYKKFYLYKVVETEYQQSWSDEFEGDTLDRSKWAVDDGFYFGGSVSTLHVDNEGETLQLKDGMMNLTSKPGRYGAWELNGTYMSTSGKFAMSYGKVEIRAKFAYGDGQFPALWMMPVDLMNMGAGEIDIMEMKVEGDINKNSEHIGTLHWTTDDGLEHWSKARYLPIYGAYDATLGDDFHTFGVEIDKDQIRMYFDGIQYNSLVLNSSGKRYAMSDTARYIIINNSTYGDGNCMINRNWGLEEEYTTQIDYVRCYIDSGDMSDNTVDLTTEDSVVYSEGIDAVATNDYWDINFPTDISPDGKEGAVADMTGNLYIYDALTNNTLKNVTMSKGKAYRVKYSPDGKRLAVATYTGLIYIFDTSNYDNAPIIIKNGCVIQENVEFTKDSKYLIVGGFNGGSQAYSNPLDGSVTEKWHFRVFDVSNGSKYQDIDVGSDPRYINVSDDGKRVAVATSENGIFIYNTSDWSEYAHLTGGHDIAIRCVDFSSDGSLLVSSDSNGVINIWDVKAKAIRNTMKNVNSGTVRRVMFSPDDKNILASSAYGAARLFNAKTGELISLLGGMGNMIRELEYSPNGEYIVVSCYDQGGLKVFAKDGTYLSTLRVGELDANDEGHIISRIKFSPDSKYVYASMRTYPNALNKWELPTVVDKTTLKNAILAADSSVAGYDYAVKVASLKYATEEMVATAYMKVYFDISTACDTVSVSADGYNFDTTATINKNGYIYLSTATNMQFDNLSVIVTETESGSEKLYTIDKSTLLSKSVHPSYGYTSRIIKIQLEEGGTYTVGLVDNDSNMRFSTASVTVDGTKTANDDFIYKIDNKEVVIVKHISGKRDIVVPDEIEGYPVTKIGTEAFSTQGTTISHMTVKLPETLKVIESSAFINCVSLRSINLPASLTTIGAKAFYNCRLLDNTVLPAGVSIGSDAFNRTNPGTITVGAGTKVTTSTYSSVMRVRELIIAEGSTAVNVNLGTQFLMEKVYIPSSVTSISGYLFTSNRNKVKLYGVAGTYAETYANNYPNTYEFVPIASPVVSGVAEGETYDLYTQSVSATWDNAHKAFLNGEPYTAGTPITEAGEYELEVINGYDTYKSVVNFTVVDTTPPPYSLGDLDEDGEITVTDALTVLRFAARLAVPEGNQFLASDLDFDKEITVSDALLVLRIAAKLAPRP